ncbi:DEAD/DEAH box helicase [Streptomyces sp. NPDC101455]|uniref:DEAD/DEAH box helicase n=1 Tax=Streptomyces sp. NPDC101455 TaxID=3366142 RepID=UPI0037F7D132
MGDAELADFAAGFEPADPPRSARVVFWRPTAWLGQARERAVPDSAVEDTVGVVRQFGSRPIQWNVVPCWRVALLDAVPELARARVLNVGHPASVFWGAVSLFGLELLSRGRLIPGITDWTFDAWRMGLWERAEEEALDALAAAMPPEARALAPSDAPPYQLSDRRELVRAFLDAMADTWPRTPAAAWASGQPEFATSSANHVPHLRNWAKEVAVGRDAGVRVGLRVDLDRMMPGSGEKVVVTVVVRDMTDPSRIWEAAELWAAGAESAGAQAQTRLTLRRGARAWPPLESLVASDVPGILLAGDTEVRELLGDAVAQLAAAGIEVLWPSEVVKNLTARLEVSSVSTSSSAPSLLPLDEVLSLRWRATLDGEDLSQADLNQLAEARRPVVRLRDRWVLVDEKVVAKIRRRAERLSGAAALRVALDGQADIDGQWIDAAVPEWLESLRERITAPAPTARSTAPPTGLKAALRDYQLAGLAWLERLTGHGLGACLADDMGLGKTITLLSLCLKRQQDPQTAGPTLVVCPASMLPTWQREAARFAPSLAVRRFHGSSRDLEGLGPSSLVLTTYGTARKDRERLACVPWNLVCADEAQHIKNPYSATAAALRDLQALARVALTGTPVENNLSDLWALLDWTTPGLLGSLRSFKARYARPVETGEDPQAAQRLATVISPFVLRRLKSDPGIAPELPPKTVSDHVVTLSREQAGLYEAVVRETLDLIAASDGITRRGLVLKLLTALKSICNHPGQYLKEGPGVRTSGRSGKLALLDELLDVVLAEGGSVLVFTQYVTMARLLERHLDGRGVATQFLHGGTPVPEREAMVDRFQRGDIPVFLLSLKAAGTGLTLTRAGHVVHFDRWWNPAVEEQATDRAYRIGQTQPVQVHRLITEGTVEDKIADMLAAKRDLAESVLASGPGALTELTDTELSDLVSLRVPR